MVDNRPTMKARGARRFQPRFMRRDVAQARGQEVAQPQQRTKGRQFKPWQMGRDQGRVSACQAPSALLSRAARCRGFIGEAACACLADAAVQGIFSVWGLHRAGSLSLPCTHCYAWHGQLDLTLRRLGSSICACTLYGVQLELVVPLSVQSRRLHHCNRPSCSVHQAEAIAAQNLGVVG